MRFHGLDLNLLVVLDTLLIERSITATAVRLHRTQPAISAALRRLRDFFNDDLFVQNGREFIPTPLALTLADPIRESLNRIQTVVIGKSEFNPAEASRHFRIIMSDYVATVFFAEIARHVVTVAPGVTFEIFQFDDEFDAPLNRGEVDFLLFPDIFLSEKHPFCKLFEDELVAVRWSEAASEPLTLSSYFAGKHVMTKFGKTRKPSIEEFLMTEVGLRRDLDVVVSNFALLPQFVVGTERIATMHRRLALHFAEFLPLQVEPLPFRLPNVQEALQWPQLNHNDPASIWLREIITAYTLRLV